MKVWDDEVRGGIPEIVHHTVSAHAYIGKQPLRNCGHHYHPSLACFYCRNMAAKVIAQIIIQGTSILSRAFVAAYGQALQSKSTSTGEWVLSSYHIENRSYDLGSDVRWPVTQIRYHMIGSQKIIMTKWSSSVLNGVRGCKMLLEINYFLVGVDFVLVSQEDAFHTGEKFESPCPASPSLSSISCVDISFIGSR